MGEFYREYADFCLFVILLERVKFVVLIILYGEKGKFLDLFLLCIFKDLTSKFCELFIVDLIN